MYQIKELLRLKDVKIIYCGKTFNQERYLTPDLKYWISVDNGCDYCTIFIADKEGHGQLCGDFYHKGSPYAYPIYLLEDAIKLINEKGLVCENIFIVNDTQYTAKSLEIVKKIN